MNFIPDWRSKNLKCHFCGETRSVKYKTKILEVKNSKINNKVEREVYACNKCILTITDLEKQF